MKNLANPQQEQIIIKILTDDIIYTRIENSLFEIHNAFNPEKKESTDSEYSFTFNGYSIALDILGIDNRIDALVEEICTYTYDVKEENKNKPADDLAKEIYFNWLIILKNYFLKVA